MAGCLVSLRCSEIVMEATGWKAPPANCPASVRLPSDARIPRLQENQLPPSDQDERRPQGQQRLRLLTQTQLLTVGVTLSTAVTAAWMLRPTGSVPSPQMATTEVMPAKPLGDRSAVSRPIPTQRAASRAPSQAPQRVMDRNPVGTIETIESPGKSFSTIQQAEPGKYTGFREVTPRR
jgi:hypothetical protein